MVIGLLLTSTVPAGAQNTTQDTGQEQVEELKDLEVRLPPHKGDIDEMDKRREVRALVAFDMPNFFFENGRPRGITYDALTELEKFLNHKLHPNDRTGKEKIHVVLVPTTATKAASDLLNGNGDMIASAIYITEERKKIVDFVSVTSTEHDVVVGGPDAPPLASLEDLSGKEVYLFKELVAWERLSELNKQLSAAKKPKINLVAADGNLSREDLIEMVNAGLVGYTVVPAHIAHLWQKVFTGTKVYEQFPVTSGLDAGWAFRKDSPKLRTFMEEFAITHRQGTAYYATLVNSYLNRRISLKIIRTLKARSASMK